MPRILIVIAAGCAALSLTAPAAAVQRPRAPLPDVDVRARDGGPVTASERRARRALERALGETAVAATDPVSGGVRRVVRPAGALTGASGDDPARIALRYVREHADAFGLGGDDLERLRLLRRYRSALGATHLAWVQVDRGVAAYDNVLLAHVAGDGRLLSVGGSAVDGLRAASVAPRRGPAEALASARAAIGVPVGAPRASSAPGPARATRFAGGDTAELTLFNDGRSTRLAWRVVADGSGDERYELVLDAADGRLLKRRSLVAAARALVYPYHPGSATRGSPEEVDLAPWLDPGATVLTGNNAHAYADEGGRDGWDPGEDVPPSSARDWLYSRRAFAPPGQACAPFGCSWDPTVAGSHTVNRNQATTQLFYLVNVFHDHLRAAPINFDHASGGFERADPASPGGGDPVRAEANDLSEFDNASMLTDRDGVPPRLQMNLFRDPARNSADAADVVFHEYSHGLSSRSVGVGFGIEEAQSKALAEGWSDWYALDYLVEQGLVADDEGTDGELAIGAFLENAFGTPGFRRQGLDCPVAASPARCPGSARAGPGGFTLHDMGRVGSAFDHHDDGEIWGETLWDLRRALRAAHGPVEGTRRARLLITGGMRMAPDNPSFIEARDAIVLADQALGGRDHDTLWAVFAARGMGYGAATASSAATTATASSALPPALAHERTDVADRAPGGDGDGVAEPGEVVELRETLRNDGSAAVRGISGTLSTSAPGFSVPQPSSGWPDVPASTALPKPAAANERPFRVAVPAGAACEATVPLALEVEAAAPDAGAGGGVATPERRSFTVPLRLGIGELAAADVPVAVRGGAGGASRLTFDGSGAVAGLEVRIARLQHTWVGDLVVRLTSPRGTTVTLIDRPGAGDDGAGGDDLVDVVLDDDAPTSIDALPATSPPGGYSGRYRPQQPLRAFDGEPRGGGPWTLTVADAEPRFDRGTLHGWGLRPRDVACPNRAPLAVDDAHAVTTGRTLAAPSVLANDGDPDGDALTAVKLSDPLHGALALAPDGTFSYTPARGFRGTDSFSYAARDGGGARSAPALVRIAVTNGAPVARPDGHSTVENTTLRAPSVLANDLDPDGHPLTAVAASAPAHGRVALAPDGTFTYTPAAGFAGVDSFAYAAHDGTEASAPTTVSIAVTRRPAVERAHPAKLQVLRAGVVDGHLDLLARITARARGTVRVEYHSAGRRTRFDAPIEGGRIRVLRALPRAQRSKPTGIVTLTYAGSERVRADDVRLRAARGKARLRRETARIDDRGRLRVAGTISRGARGVVRVRLGYDLPGGGVAFLRYRAPIRAGRWTLTEPLPPAAARAGGQLSIQFTGYEPRRIRGEQLAKAVAP